jgi:hypothetical protein
MAKIARRLSDGAIMIVSGIAADGPDMLALEKEFESRRQQRSRSQQKSSDGSQISSSPRGQSERLLEEINRQHGGGNSKENVNDCTTSSLSNAISDTPKRRLIEKHNAKGANRRTRSDGYSKADAATGSGVDQGSISDRSVRTDTSASLFNSENKYRVKPEIVTGTGTGIVTGTVTVTGHQAILLSGENNERDRKGESFPSDTAVRLFHSAIEQQQPLHEEKRN